MLLSHGGLYRRAPTHSAIQSLLAWDLASVALCTRHMRQARLSEEGGVVAWESPDCCGLRPGVGGLIALNPLVRGRPSDVARVVAVSDSSADLVGGYGQALAGTHLICANALHS